MIENLPGQFVCLIMNKAVVLIVEASGGVIEIKTGVPPPHG